MKQINKILYRMDLGKHTIQVAEKTNIDIIVLGKSSSRIRGNRVMRSTARRVCRLAKLPVLVVPNR